MYRQSFLFQLVECICIDMLDLYSQYVETFAELIDIAVIFEIAFSEKGGYPGGRKALVAIQHIKR